MVLSFGLSPMLFSRFGFCFVISLNVLNYKINNMRKIILFLICTLSTFLTFAQAPQLMNYQGVVRDATGSPYGAGINISVRFQIHDGTNNGTVVYVETTTATTNQFGLINLQIGANGDLSTVNWGSGPKYLEVDIDPNGGNNFTSMGTSQLVSVPYALFSANSLAGPQGPTGAPGNDGSTGAQGSTGGANLPDNAIHHGIAWGGM